MSIPHNIQARLLYAILVSIVLGCVAATAQSDEDDKVVKLSPFTVTADSDVGYVGAQSALGSRLKQQAKDIPAQLEIMTPEFLQDLGITDLDDAFRYTTNVENSTEFLNPINASNAYFSGQTEGRIRGITTIPFTTSRNLFSSITKADSFNFSRIEVASGAQSMLYGIGAPAGLANVTLNVAEMRNFGHLSSRVTSESGYRAVLDLNRLILPKVLALRVALLQENNPSFIKPSKDEDSRIYGTLTYRPFKNTNIRVHGERVTEDINPGITQLPWDYATPFYLAQQNGTAGSIATTNFGATSTSPTYLYGANDASISLVHWRTMLIPLGPGQLPYDQAHYGSAKDPNVGAARTTFNPDTLGLVPEAAANLGRNFMGDNMLNHIKSSMVDLFLEQRLLDTLSFEAALHSERWEKRLETLSSFSQYGFIADINKYIPTAPWIASAAQPTDAKHANYELNPNYGKVFARSTPDGTWDINRTDEYRASLVWQPEFQKISKWFGQHSFLASVSSRSTEGKNQPVQLKFSNANLDYQGLSGAFTNARRVFLLQHYFDQNHLTVTTPFPGMSLGDYFTGWQLVEPITGEVVDVTGWESFPMGGGRPSGSKTEVDTLVLSWLGRFLEDRVLLSYGFRRDAVKQYTLNQDAGGPNQLVAEGGWRWINQIDFDSEPDVTASNNSHTYGVIIRPLPLVSLSYYASSTFNLPTGQQTPFGEPVQGSFGESVDYSVRFDLNEGKSFLKLDRYETTQFGNNSASAAVRINTIAMEKSYAAIVDARAIDQGTPDYDTLIVQQGFGNGVTANNSLNEATFPILGDKLAEGWEITAGARLGHWDLRLSGAKNTAVDTNVSGDWAAWINARLPFWKDAVDVNGARWSATPYQGPSAENYNVIDPTTGVARTMTMEEYYNNVVIGALAVAQSRNDNPVDTSRKYRANLNVAYSFTAGKLKGLRAGGGLRYRSKPVLGFPVIDLPNPDGGLPLPGLDLEHPYYGDEDYDVDLFVAYNGRNFLGSKLRYSVQINGRDLFTDKNTFVIGKVNGRKEPTFVYLKTPRSFSTELTLFF